MEKAKEYLEKFNTEYSIVEDLPSHALVNLRGEILPSSITNVSGDHLTVVGGQYSKDEALTILNTIIVELKRISGDSSIESSNEPAEEVLTDLENIEVQPVVESSNEQEEN